MVNIASWNIRGLNWPNKQEDVKIFLQKNQISFIGLLETKVKKEKVHTVASRIFHGWEWQHNFNHNAKGRIWVAWKPQVYRVQILKITEQMIHCEAHHVTKLEKFFITYVYGFNHAQERLALWEDLQNIANSMTEAWCVLGDFNAILHPEDRMGGTEVIDSEIRDFSDCLLYCELEEMRNSGPYYSWTNKKIWSRIDRVLLNSYWYNSFNYTNVSYLANSLSDHTPILINFPSSTKPHTQFQYCDMWGKHPDFHNIINDALPRFQGNPLIQLKKFYDKLRTRLRLLNKNHYADLHEQKERAKRRLEEIQLQLHDHPRNNDLQRHEKEARNHYISILSSVMDLLKQQSKIEWIKYGDDCTCLLYTSPSPRDGLLSRMPSSA